MTRDELHAWLRRRYGVTTSRLYGPQDAVPVYKRAAAELAISGDTLRKYLYGAAPIGPQTVRIIELLDRIESGREASE